MKIGTTDTYFIDS